MTDIDRRQWLEDRRQGIGASEIAAIMGVSPYMSPMSVYAEKIGVELPSPDRRSSLQMRLGNELEGLVVDETSHVTGYQIDRNGISFALDGRPHIRATPDGLAIDPLHPDNDGVAEVKVVGSHKSHEWDGGITPLCYQLQVQQQMLVMGCSWAVIGALLLESSSVVVRTLRADPELQQDIIAACDHFWRAHVLPRIPPPADGRPVTSRAVRALHPSDSGLMIRLGEDASESKLRLDAAKQERRSLDETIAAHENTIRMAMGDATYGIAQDGTGVSLKSQTRGSTTFRVLRNMSPTGLANVAQEAETRLRGSLS